MATNKAFDAKRHFWGYGGVSEEYYTYPENGKPKRQPISCGVLESDS